MKKKYPTFATVQEQLAYHMGIKHGLKMALSIHEEIEKKYYADKEKNASNNKG